jgi:flagellar biosynthesis protein FlhG
MNTELEQKLAVDLEPEGFPLLNKEIWAVGGGKGGTGKSFLTSSLGLFLAKRGKRVLLIDADLGCANLHTCLGMDYPEATLSDFMMGRVACLKDTLVETGIPNLMLVSGAQDFLEIANPHYSQKMRLIRQIQSLDFDYILLDLGAGTSFNILDFFLISNSGILSVLPEPTSIENVYRFIKSAFYHRFKRVTKEPKIREVISAAMDQKNQRGIKTPHDLLNQVVLMDEESGNYLKGELFKFRPRVVVNQVRSKDDITLGFSMRSCCSQYFGISLEYLGYIEHDDCVWQATKKKRPLLIEYPNSSSARGIAQVTYNLLNHKQLAFNFPLYPDALSRSNFF